MQSKALENGYLLKLEKGERILESLSVFCKTVNIDSGLISGVGGASDITLGYYNLDRKEYTWRNFEEIHEIVSMSGNISIVDASPFFHIHAVISNEDFQAFGGHLKEGKVAATCEIVIRQINTPLARKTDNLTGLKLLDLEV